MSINKIEQHPFLFVFLLWAFFFVSFACFKIDSVTPVSYIAAMAFFGTFSYLFAKQKEKIRKIPKENQKALLCMLAGVIYAGIMMYTFDHVRSSPAIRSRNDIVPFLFLTVAVIAYSIYISIRKKRCEKRIILVIILFSSIIHLFFLMSSKFNLSQWDMGGFFSGGGGHDGYIEYLYDNNLIPAQFDPRLKWQFYHPPLHYLIEAFLLKLQSWCGIDIRTAVNNIQYPPVLYTMISTVCSYLIFKEMKLKKTGLICATAVAAFSPAFIFVGEFCNNDMLAWMFTFLCILYTLRWYKNPTAKNILKIGLFFGLGMLSKMSVALIAPSIAIIFLYSLIKKLILKDKKTFWKYFGQMCAFLGLAAPLSLYWYVRNFIRFGVPFGYIPKSELEMQYISDPIAKRLFDFSPKLFAYPYFHEVEFGNTFNEYNPIIALLKTSASDTGLVRFQFGLWMGYVTLWTTVIVALIAFVFMIYAIFSQNSFDDIIYKFFWSLTYVVYLLSYECFCIKYPYTCTEQVRYAMPLIIIGALFIGLGLKEVLNKKIKILVCFGYFAVVSVMLFSLTSVFVFTYYGIYTTLAFML